MGAPWGPRSGSPRPHSGAPVPSLGPAVSYGPGLHSGTTAPTGHKNTRSVWGNCTTLLLWGLLSLTGQDCTQVRQLLQDTKTHNQYEVTVQLYFSGACCLLRARTALRYDSSYRTQKHTISMRHEYNFTSLGPAVSYGPGLHSCRYDSSYRTQKHTISMRHEYNFTSLGPAVSYGPGLHSGTTAPTGHKNTRSVWGNCTTLLLWGLLSLTGQDCTQVRQLLQDTKTHNQYEAWVQLYFSGACCLLRARTALRYDSSYRTQSVWGMSTTLLLWGLLSLTGQDCTQVRQLLQDTISMRHEYNFTSLGPAVSYGPGLHSGTTAPTGHKNTQSVWGMSTTLLLWGLLSLTGQDCTQVRQLLQDTISMRHEYNFTSLGPAVSYGPGLHSGTTAPTGHKNTQSVWGMSTTLLLWGLLSLTGQDCTQVRQLLQDTISMRHDYNFTSLGPAVSYGPGLHSGTTAPTGHKNTQSVWGMSTTLLLWGLLSLTGQDCTQVRQLLQDTKTHNQYEAWVQLYFSGACCLLRARTALRYDSSYRTQKHTISMRYEYNFTLLYELSSNIFRFGLIGQFQNPN